MMKIVAASEAKTRFYKLLKKVISHREKIVVTQQGKPAAIILSCSDFERIIATMDVLSDPIAMKRIREAKRYTRKGGKFLTHEEVWGEPQRK